MSKLLQIALIFGGVSSEHDVSCVSAQNFMTSFMQMADRYTVLPIYIARDGQWFLYEGDRLGLKNAPALSYARRIAVVPGGCGQLLITDDQGVQNAHVDVAIPVLHGLNGEDGTIQGLFEMARIPYAGCGVLASALAMDKVFTKKIVDHLGIRQAAYFDFTRRQIEEDAGSLVEAVEKRFAYPVFVKPSRAGSSVGVTKAHDGAQLLAGLKLAAAEDRRVLVEEFINGREVECAVLGSNGKAQAYEVGEVLAAEEFYSFDAKYANAESRTVVPAHIEPEKRQELLNDAKIIFEGIDGEGLSRVDFFIEKETGEVVFNEINTFPGFTPISMWPMLMAASGVNGRAQIEALVEMAMERKPLYGA